MKQLEDHIQDPGGRGPALGLGVEVGTVQDRLGQLDIPVAVGVPDEPIEKIGRLVEATAGDGLGHRRRGAGRLADDPAVDRPLGGRRVKALDADAAIDLAEPRCIP